MRVDGGRNFGLGQGIKLIEEKDRGAGVVATTAFRTEFVADLTAGDQDALRVGDFAIGNQRQEARPFEFFNLEEASGWRSMLFGVKTISGLRHSRRAWRRNR